jgi:hypothetical protein
MVSVLLIGVFLVDEAVAAKPILQEVVNQRLFDGGYEELKMRDYGRKFAGVLSSTPEAHSTLGALLFNRSKEFTGKSRLRLLDVGCGPGMFVEAARQAGMDAHGIDGSPSNGLRWPVEHRDSYALADLTKLLKAGNTPDAHGVVRTLKLLAGADVVTSFEVAEHVGQQYARDFVRLLTAHNPKIIFFSAATPGQTGLSHVNCQPQSYWKRLFEKEGYILDVLNTVHTRNALFSDKHFTECWWYPKNIMVFTPHPPNRALEIEQQRQVLQAQSLFSNLKWFDETSFNSYREQGFTKVMQQRDFAEYQFFVAEANMKANYLCTTLHTQLTAHVQQALHAGDPNAAAVQGLESPCWKLDGSEPMQEKEVSADADWF